jgi:integrase
MARKNGKDRGILQRKGREGWWVRIFHNGREHWHMCDSKSQAKALYGRLKAEAREGKYFEKPKAVPFRELAMDYMTAVDARRRRKGDDNSRIKRWITAFGDQDAASITPRQIERVLTDLQTEGREAATMVRYLTVLKAMLNRAKRLGLLKDNPACFVQSPKVNNVLVRYLTPDQEDTLLGALPERFRALVLTALNTGLRQGELLRLTWADVDSSVGILTIQETKAGDRRRVPMNSAVQGILTDLKARTSPGPTDRIFSHDDRYLRRAFDRAVKISGLTPFRFHDLRHTFASRLAMQGANDRTIMALGGWKSPRMLDRYAHLSPAYLWQAVEGLTRVGTVTKTVTRQDDRLAEKSQAFEKTGAGKGI